MKKVRTKTKSATPANSGIAEFESPKPRVFYQVRLRICGWLNRSTQSISRIFICTSQMDQNNWIFLLKKLNPANTKGSYLNNIVLLNAFCVSSPAWPFPYTIIDRCLFVVNWMLCFGLAELLDDFRRWNWVCALQGFAPFGPLFCHDRRGMLRHCSRAEHSLILIVITFQSPA